MKKELKWSFDIIEIPLTEYPTYAICTSAANCYFTRPLYDEQADENKASGSEEHEGKN